MKRNMDLIRSILLALEKVESAGKMQQLSIDGIAEEVLSYHVKLLFQAGLIEAHDASGVNDFKWYPVSLTWDGHEFIEAARNDTTWKNVTSQLIEKTGGLVFEVLKGSLIKSAVQLMQL
ncbi:MAG: DUF2513 domain-containing protein [Gammaproteobacteria bacterium]|nr:DUF2513 domain-containing protein [Gammaproteobacteria bacterium]